MIFDGHGDIWTDVAIKREGGRHNVIKDMHLDRFRRGDMIGGIFVIWIDPPHDERPMERTLEIIEHMSTEIMENRDILKIIYNSSDFKEAIVKGQLAIIIGMEGLSSIGTRINLINALYMFGVRHVSLTWNEENPLATGVRGNPDRGLTQLGKEATKLLEKLGIIIDVSHANDKTFWDIYENTTRPFIASHSNCRALCNVPRNLTDEELKAIAERGGVVGINAFNEFVHVEKGKRDVTHLVNHIDYMVEIMGIDHIGFGFDFFEYLQSNTVDSFIQDSYVGTIGLEDISMSQNIIDILKNRGYSGEDIKKISYKNFLRIIKEIMG